MSSIGRPLIVAVLAATVLSGAIASERASPSTPVTVGKTAPDFSLHDQDGNVVTLSKQRGKKVVLVFYRGFW